MNLRANTRYQSPNNSVAELEIAPTSLKYKNAIPGIPKDTLIIVTARNADFNVTNITSTNPAYSVTPTSFFLGSGQSRNLTVRYLPADSGYTYTKFAFENDNCPRKYYASGGWKGKKPTIRTLKLLHPNGGEVFVAGSDTIITWEGVGPDDPVLIEYRINNVAKWDTIADKVTGLSYNWRVPRTPSNQCLARVTANLGYVTSEIDGMVLIPAGTFQMGNTGAYSGESNEKPLHTVTISRDFLMSKYEISQKQYEEVMGANPSYFKGENLPVEQVTWYEVVEFCNKLSEMEGLDKCYSGSGTSIVCDWDANGYRLPTEAEWEYACKAGTTTDFYSGSLTSSADCTPIDANLDKIGWYCGNEGTKTREVGKKEPNAFGLYDMSGNVWEWCWDWYGSYSSSSETDPKGLTTGSYRVRRGGGWFTDPGDCRSANRHRDYPSNRYFSMGFRVVVPQ